MSEISKFQSEDYQQVVASDDVLEKIIKDIGVDKDQISKPLNGDVDEIDFAALLDFIGDGNGDYLKWGSKFMVEGAHNPRIYARLEVLEKHKRNQDFLSRLEINQDFLKSIMLKNSFDTKSLRSLHKKAIYVRKLLFPNRDKIEFLIPTELLG